MGAVAGIGTTRWYGGYVADQRPGSGGRGQVIETGKEEVE